MANLTEKKFRGKHIKTGEWLFGSLINNAFVKRATNQPCCYIFDANKMEYDCFEDIGEQLGDFEVEPDSVGQFTGFHDKHDKEIWEGDLVRYVPDFFDKDQREKVFKVEWGRWSYVRRELDSHELPWTFDAIEARSHYEVIGNIFSAAGGE